MACEPLSAPWIIPSSAGGWEIRFLFATACDPMAEPPLLLWRAPGAVDPGVPVAMEAVPAALGPGVWRAAGRLPAPDERGLCYRIRCGERGTPWIRLSLPAAPGEDWRLLLLSDHQQKPGVRRTLAAIDRRAVRGRYHGLLFAGDLTHLPDRLESWAGDPEGLGFFDHLGAPAAQLFGPESAAGGGEAPPGWPLISTLPCIACPGNHEISVDLAAGSPAQTPEERFRSVTPENWSLAVYAALFLPSPAAPAGGLDPHAVAVPAGPGGRPAGWYRARLGPLDLLSLFAARRWVHGDHDTRTGPCYEPPGRFIFADVRPGSAQYVWLQQQIGATPEDVSAAGAPAGGARPLRIALLHHAPFAQGHNARPPFGDPIVYAADHLVAHWVPLFARWADLVLSGHNHAVNHHCIDGVHYLESSHMGAGFPPARLLPDGRVAPEPHGHRSRFFASEPEQTFYAELAAGAGGRAGAEITIRRVFADGRDEEAYRFTLGAV
jgi:hypothetical protein